MCPAKMEGYYYKEGEITNGHFSIIFLIYLPVAFHHFLWKHFFLFTTEKKITLPWSPSSLLSLNVGMTQAVLGTSFFSIHTLLLSNVI